jgi:hypothetical protein
MKITRTMQDMVRVKRLAVHPTGSGPASARPAAFCFYP